VVGAREAYRAWRAGEVAIVDVREEAEHIVTRVPGVPLLPLSELLERVEELPEGPLVVMCRSGSRSAAVVEYLRDRGGRPDAANLEGGILAWAAEGLPYEGEPPR
jgi:rhodanese-related sulfurtransferase